MPNQLAMCIRARGSAVRSHCRGPDAFQMAEFFGRLRVPRWLRPFYALLTIVSLCVSSGLGQEFIVTPGQAVVVAPAPATNDLKVELYIRPDSEQCKKAVAYVAELERKRPGIRVQVYDVSQDAAALARVKALSSQFGRSAALPTVYAANQLVVGFRDAATTGRQIESLFTMEVFIRNGCPRCAAATPYLAGLKQRYPGLDVVFYEVTNDPGAQARLAQLNQKYGVPSGIPTVHFGGQLTVGWSGIEITGAQVEGILRNASAPPKAAEPAQVIPGSSSLGPLPRLRQLLTLVALIQVPGAPPGTPGSAPESLQSLSGTEHSGVTSSAGDELPLEAELPAEAVAGSDEVLRPTALPPPDFINVPVFGRLDVHQVGMPVFTVVLGLIDGFNPCAMWVLVFLLSVLVTLNDRRKMITIAGTFVLVSGLAYFLFMVAWLNAFQLVGVLNPSLVPKIQALLGVLAIIVGFIHIKDFFAFKKGITLSIPESAKPTIYARVRQIVSAKSLLPALFGATILAVLVNLVELLCTAGIPALYTQTLVIQKYPFWMNYVFIGLYILAYMFDDSIMLIIVVATLSRRRLQETQGRWLKLVSGAVILCLGVVMLAKPEWLH